MGNKCLRKFLGKRFDDRWASGASVLDFNLSQGRICAGRSTRMRVARYIFAVFILISSRQTQIHNSAADNQKDEPLARDAVEEHLFWSAVRTRRFSLLLDSSATREPRDSAWNIYARWIPRIVRLNRYRERGRWKYVQDTSRIEQQYKWPHETFNRK